MHALQRELAPLRNRAASITAVLLVLVLGSAMVASVALSKRAAESTAADGQPSSSSAAAAKLAMPYDFDGDGRAELVTTTTTPPDKGDARFAVACCTTLQIKHSKPGSPTMSLRRDGQTLPEAAGVAKQDAGLASAIASADFNRDGYADLAIGTVPRASAAASPGTAAGDVLVVGGSPGGLDLERVLRLDQDTEGVPGGNEAGDRFGDALAAGDVTGDGYADLAVGVPGESVDEQPAVSRGGSVSGRVVLFRGARAGLDTRSHEYGAPSGTELGGSKLYSFGDALAVGRLDAEGGPADLAVLGRDQDGVTAVFVLTGTARGDAPLDTAAARVVRWADFPELPPLRGERLPLVAGDANGDGIDELATVSYLRTGSDPFEGAVAVIAGTPAGGKHTVTLLSQASKRMPGAVNGSEGLGMTARFGDLTGDGLAELAVGFPLDRDRKPGAGAVLVLAGSADGLSSRDATLVTQDSPGVAGSAEADDRFGSALSLSDRTGDGIGDLLVGAAGETTKAADAAGTLTLFTGRKGAGVSTDGAEAHGYAHFGFGDSGDGQVFGGRLP